MAFTRKVLYGLRESLASLSAAIQSWANRRFSLLGHTHNDQSTITKYVRSYNGSTGVSDVTGVSKISVNGGTVASPNAAGLVDLTISIPSMPDINYPVTKVNELTGNVVITLASLGGVTASQCVTSYNGNKGAVTGVSVIKLNGSTLSPSNGIVDLGTIQVSQTEVPVQSVQGLTGAVTLYGNLIYTYSGSNQTIAAAISALYSSLTAGVDPGHTHSAYALTSHTHSTYALTSHTHSTYALTSHTHLANSVFQADGNNLQTTADSYWNHNDNNERHITTGERNTWNSNTIPSGAIMWFYLQAAPSGWKICDGTNGTPNLIGRYPLGATSDIGDAVNAGLPNITGGTLAVELQTNTWGAFYHGVNLANSRCGAQKDIGPTVKFDASKSNSIYGSSDTVTPPSVKLLPCMKI